MGRPNTNILHLAPLGVALSEAEWARRPNRAAPLVYSR
jgi:hypothetical protein